MKSKYANIVIIFVIMVVCTLSMGHAAFGSELSISEIVADVRIEADVRVTSVMYNNSTNGAISSSEDYDVNSVVGRGTLPNSNSTITYQIGVTNFGNQEMGIYSIFGLPSNLTYELTDYNLHDKLCDTSGNCTLGATKVFGVTIKYVDGGYNSLNTTYDIRLDFEFRKMHQVTYTGITNNNYPTSVIDGGTLTFTATSNIPPKIVAFYSNNDRVNYSDYSYVNNVFTYNNVTTPVTLKYLTKAYMGVMSDNIYYKESAYKTKIDSVQFVDYVDTSNAVKVYDLSETSGSQDVIGWITADNDLYIGSEWNIYSKNLDCTFHGMSGIQTIAFGNFNTSECTNMHYMFKDCSGLTSLDVSSFDTSKVTNMGRMFQDCSKLSSLDVTNFNTSNVTNMQGLFNGLLLVENIDVSNFITSKVINMNYLFANMQSLKEIDVSNFDTSNVITMLYMFYYCSSLTNLDLATFNTSKVTTMESMFQYCTNLTKLNVTSFNTKNVERAHGMFAHCRSLAELDVSSFDVSNIYSMSYMFHDMGALTSLDLSNFKTTSLTSTYNMFSSCFSLKKLDIRNFDFSLVTRYDGMFTSTPSTINIVVKDSDSEAFIRNVLGEEKGTITIASV